MLPRDELKKLPRTQPDYRHTLISPARPSVRQTVLEIAFGEIVIPAGAYTRIPGWFGPPMCATSQLPTV